MKPFSMFAYRGRVTARFWMNWIRPVKRAGNQGFRG